MFLNWVFSLDTNRTYKNVWWTLPESDDDWFHYDVEIDVYRHGWWNYMGDCLKKGNTRK